MYTWCVWSPKKEQNKTKKQKREKEGNGISGNKYKNFPDLMNDVSRYTMNLFKLKDVHMQHQTNILRQAS